MRIILPLFFILIRMYIEVFLLAKIIIMDKVENGKVEPKNYKMPKKKMMLSPCDSFRQHNLPACTFPFSSSMYTLAHHYAILLSSWDDSLVGQLTLYTPFYKFF